VRPLICFDYKALQSSLSLRSNYLYVSNDVRCIEWNFSTSTYQVLANPHLVPPTRNTVRFDSLTPRTSDEFKKSTKSLFPNGAFDVPLCQIYLDYDVHLVKAIIHNVLMTLCEVADAKVKAAPRAEQGELSTAFATLDNEYATFFYLHGCCITHYV